MTIKISAFCALLSALGSPIYADWGEPHLSPLPRTEAEIERIAGVLAPALDFDTAERFETHPAGAATHFNHTTRLPFSLPSENMPFDRQMDFTIGDNFFERLWVAAPASTQASDGLGPLYNARACQQCHVNDGRGHPPETADDPGVSMFLRVSVPKAVSTLTADTLRYLANAPEPSYGIQLQDKTIAGIESEGRMQIRYAPLPVTLDDGTVITLRKPTYHISDLHYGPLHPQAQISPRVAPQMIGLGLLEAIPEADILARADPDDTDGDGISGRANRVWSLEYDQWMLGRFGYKAGNPTLRQQAADAFLNDIGLSTPIHPYGWGDCTKAQEACRAAPNGNTARDENLEVPTDVLDFVTFYTRNLAVPARRTPDDPTVLRGKEMFYTARCTACHTPKHVTHRLPDQPEQSFQLIWPYTDLLLHDMGDGLADDRPEWQATGREWRTPPLWGIGLTEQVAGTRTFLHDGRARSLLEAILWHGGEAEPARNAVRAMPKTDRDALIKFLESL